MAKKKNDDDDDDADDGDDDDDGDDGDDDDDDIWPWMVMKINMIRRVTKRCVLPRVSKRCVSSPMWQEEKIYVDRKLPSAFLL